MNQIPLNILEELGIFRNRAIYYGLDLSEMGVKYAGALLINPREMKISRSSGEIVEEEHCGSILNGRLGMVVLRPTEVSFCMDGIFSPSIGFQKMKGKRIVINGIGTGFFQHEYDHLEGKTALDFPDRILDPRGRSQGERNQEQRDGYWLGRDLNGSFFIVKEGENIVI